VLEGGGGQGSGGYIRLTFINLVCIEDGAASPSGLTFGVTNFFAKRLALLADQIVLVCTFFAMQEYKQYKAAANKRARENAYQNKGIFNLTTEDGLKRF